MTDYALGDRGTLTVITNDYYDAEILQVFEELQIDREKIWNGEAYLVPEPDNPYEPQSIAVYVDTIKIGRFSSEDSAQYWKAISRVAASGYNAVAHLQLSAVLRRGEDGTYIESEGLLSLSAPTSLFPLNDAPTQATLLPQGPSMKVLDEKDYAEYLHSILPASGEGRVILTLEANQLRQSDGTFIDSIEVFHNRKKVGRLSTQMSKQLVPVVKYAFSHNRLTSVWGTIRGNAFELSLTVQAVRVADLPAEWYEELPNNVPELLPESDHYDVPDSYKATEGELNRQSGTKKKRSLVGSFSPSAPTEQRAVSSTKATAPAVHPQKRMGTLLAIIGALLVLAGFVLVLAKPIIGILAIVLGASVAFLGVYTSRSIEAGSEDSLDF